MDGRSSHASDDFKHGGGLELSLGLSLQVKGGQEALEAGDGSGDGSSSVAGGIAEEGSAGGELPYNNSDINRYGRGNGLDTALKKFLEGRLDEHKEFANGESAHQQGSSIWELCGNNPSIEDQNMAKCVSDNVSRGFARNDSMPVTLQFMDNASPTSPARSTAASEVPSPHAGTSEVQSLLEKKQKCKEIEEQKVHKMLKRDEERSMLYADVGFRRPGNDLWVQGFADRGLVPFDESQHVQNDIASNEGDDLMKKRSLEIAFSAPVGVHDKAAEVQFRKPSIAENQDNHSMPEHVTPGISSNHQEGEVSALSCQKAGSLCKSSSTESTISKREEGLSRGGECEVSSAAPSSIKDEGPASAHAFTLTTGMTNGVFHPSSSAQAPFSVHASISNMSGVPFPAAGFTFPYMMPFTAPLYDGHGQSTCNYQSTFGQGHPRFEGGVPWPQTLRPPVAGNTSFSREQNNEGKGIESGASQGSAHMLQRNGVIACSQNSNGAFFVSPFGSLGALVNPTDPHAIKEQGIEVVVGNHEQAKSGYGVGPVARMDDPNGAHQNDVHQEELGCPHGFYRGTTEGLPSLEGFTQEMASLWPGLPAGLKFGGSGSVPDLPWVSTTSSNGKVVSGVLYKINTNQLQIVCACHGKHMSTGEFLQHASTVDVSS